MDAKFKSNTGLKQATDSLLPRTCRRHIAKDCLGILPIFGVDNGKLLTALQTSDQIQVKTLYWLLVSILVTCLSSQK